MVPSLYREELLDHYRYPRNYGTLSEAQVAAEALNPSCGDEIIMQLKVEEGIISAVRFQGKGCVISQAAASLLTERVMGSSLVELDLLKKEDMLLLVGIPLGPTRLRCALLSLEALQAALIRYRRLLFK